MSPSFNLLDVLLAVVLLGYLFYGFSRGFFNSLFSLAGLVLGGVAAFSAAPWVSAQVDPQYRVGAVLATVLVLLVAGQMLGGLLGRALSAVTERMRLGALNRIAGAALDVASWASRPCPSRWRPRPCCARSTSTPRDRCAPR
jgi:uncharacterized membrane protein required for colicin V production